MRCVLQNSNGTETPVCVVGCSLCRAVANACGPQSKRNRENTVLASSKSFLVLPCVGPLVPGHVLVVSRDHAPSLSAMGAAAIQEYDRLAAKYLCDPLFPGGDALEAEHGAVDSDSGSACVVHTHVHWIPGHARFASVLDGRAARLSIGDKLVNLKSTNGPYVFTRASGKPAHFYDAKGLSSQALRRAICEEEESTNWDWKQAARWDWIDEAIHRWGELA